ncbi:hypothetical protein I3843_Q009700 [Carya illinoinensis]|nr:hypothetical protein I3843_Q009700 [Carya illinoinensis]
MAFQLGASSSSLSSSPSIHSRNHHVFLSFRGKDVRLKFISHLNQALRQSGIMTYMDDGDLERGDQISSEHFKAIEESSISIIVLSKNYAKSKWCLDNLLKILECKRKKKQIILPIFYEVKPSEVQDHEKGCFGEAFTRLGKKIKLGDIKLLEYWKEALEEVTKLFGFYFFDRDDESEFIQNIIQWLNSRILNQTPLCIATYPIVIESRIRDIYQHLNLERNDIVRMVGIFGIGGIGKTTFSKDIYNRISSQFDGSCFFSNIRDISKSGGLIKLQKILLSEILGKNWIFMMLIKESM